MSGRGTHHAGGAVLGLAVAAVAQQLGAETAIGIYAVSTVTAAGWLSPDVDQSWWWRRLDKVLPDELLGEGGPLQHRGITHWWGVTVGWAVLWVVASVAVPAVWWVGAGHVAGWTSHLLLDRVFGRRVITPQGAVVVRAGIPLAPWWNHTGGVWRSSGPESRFAGVVLTFVALAQAVALLATGSPS